MPKIALGTVQFGMDYGIANKSGKIATDEIVSILNYAKQNNIGTLDTAPDYGDSELCLGNLGVNKWKVVTKLKALPEDVENIEAWVEDQVRGSLSRLNISVIHGLMLHKQNQLSCKHSDRLWRAVLRVKNLGLVKKVGYSVYDPEEISRYWERYRPDIIQAPYNVFDRRIKTSNWLSKLHNNNVEVHIRSIFLQGLLLVNKQDRPIKFKKWGHIWSKWDHFLEGNQISAIDACLSFAMQEEMINYIVIGVDSEKQLRQILNCKKHDLDFPEELDSSDLDLISPQNWSNI